MNLIAKVEELTALQGRLEAIRAAKREMNRPNYALLERLEIEKKLAGAASAMLDVLCMIRPGDAWTLSFVLSGEYRLNGCNCEKCREATEVLRRMQEMCRKMEETHVCGHDWVNMAPNDHVTCRKCGKVEW
jgi:hypothetical protein